MKNRLKLKLDNERDDLESHLQEVSDKLYEMESDKAESRAAGILYGLGFTKETQHTPTKQFSGVENEIITSQGIVLSTRFIVIG